MGQPSGADPGWHLLAALDHAHGVVLGQAKVQAKTNEIPMLPLLLDQIGLAFGAWGTHAPVGGACGPRTPDRDARG